MWILRFLVTLLVRTVVIAAAAFALAGILAVAGAGTFLAGAKIMCILVGCVLIGMAGVGRGSNLERFTDYGATQAVWGKIPGFDPGRRFDTGEPTLSPGAAFFCSGALLIAFGLAVL